MCFNKESWVVLACCISPIYHIVCIICRVSLVLQARCVVEHFCFFCSFLSLYYQVLGQAVILLVFYFIPMRAGIYRRSSTQTSFTCITYSVSSRSQIYVGCLLHSTHIHCTMYMCAYALYNDYRYRSTTARPTAPLEVTLLSGLGIKSSCSLVVGLCRSLLHTMYVHITTIGGQCNQTT